MWVRKHALAAVGVVLLAGGVFVGTRRAPGFVEIRGLGRIDRNDCGMHYWPRCQSYGWAEVATAFLTSGGLALTAAAFARWVTARRERKPAPSSSIRPPEGLSTWDALLFVAVPIFIIGMVSAAIFFNFIVKYPTGD